MAEYKKGERKEGKNSHILLSLHTNIKHAYTVYMSFTYILYTHVRKFILKKRSIFRFLKEGQEDSDKKGTTHAAHILFPSLSS